MSSEDSKLVAVDGRDALASVIIRPGSSEGTVSLEAWAKDIDKPAAARVLRHVADMWDPRTGLTGVLDEIAAEREKQDARWGEQNHPDGTSSDPTSRLMAESARALCQLAGSGVTWRRILDEEFREALAEEDPAKLRAELVQVGAVAVAWIEAIDRRTPPAPGGLEQLLAVVAEQLPADDPVRAAEGLAAMPLPDATDPGQTR